MPLVLGSTVILILVGMFFLLMLYIFNKRQVKFKVEKKLMEVQHQETLLKTQLEIQEQTLQNISAEIHDNIIQLLSLSKLKMNSILQEPDEPAAGMAGETKEILSQAISDLRSLSHHMNGDYIMNKGLQQSILSTFQQMGTHKNLKTSLSQLGEEYLLGGDREIILFRIFQEALNNSLKHSGATAISVELNYGLNKFFMQIFDNGNGFNSHESNEGIGLKNIKNRASLMKAGFELRSSPAEGTLIRITIPRTNG